MIRHYFNDPLVAAWMAKHFEMQTYIGHLPDDFDSYGPRNWWLCQDDWQYRQEKMGQPAPKFFIHPNSLRFLEDFTPEQKAAMHLLGLWPESEVA